MHQSQIEILTTFRIDFRNEKLWGFYITVTTNHFCRYFFYVDTGGKQVAFAKQVNAGNIWWTGNAITVLNVLLCETIEKQTGITLACLPDTDPFAFTGNLPVTITQFYIDGLKISKAKTPYDDIEAVYYQLHIEEGWSPKIAYVRIPLNDGWEWMPVTKIEKGDFEFMVEMISEYEDGTYEANRQLNDGLLLLLRNLKSGKRPATD